MQPDNDGRKRRVIMIAAALIVTLTAVLTAVAIRAARDPGEPEVFGAVPEPEAVAAAASAPAPMPASVPTHPAEPAPSPELPDVYIVRAYEGYIAVFRPESAKPESMTDTRISSLRRADQILLREGVTIQGRESLARFLEDFSY